MAEHAHRTLTEQFANLEESPVLKKVGFVCALIVALVVALALAHYVGLYWLEPATREQIGESMVPRQFSVTESSAVLVINCGSSSIKFALFAADPTLRRVLSGALDRIGLADSRFHAKDSTGNVLIDEQRALANHKVGLALLVEAHQTAARWSGRFSVSGIGSYTVATTAIVRCP